MGNCDIPLGKEERGEMSADRQRGTLEAMGLMKKEEPTKEVGDGRAATVTESPKPQRPIAPTYARDPIIGSQNLLGGNGSKGDSKGKRPKSDSKGKGSICDSKGKDSEGDRKGYDTKGDPNGRDSKGKDSKGKDGKGRKIPTM